MTDSRDTGELDELRRQNQRLADDLAHLEREHHRLRCEYRRVCEELDWREERVRVLERVIVRQDREIQRITAAAHQLL